MVHWLADAMRERGGQWQMDEGNLAPQIAKHLGAYGQPRIVQARLLSFF